MRRAPRQSATQHGTDGRLTGQPTGSLASVVRATLGFVLAGVAVLAVLAAPLVTAGTVALVAGSAVAVRLFDLPARLTRRRTRRVCVPGTSRCVRV